MSVADQLVAGYEFRPLGTYRAQLGESPFLSHDALHIWWVDTTGKRLLRTNKDTGAEQVWPVPEEIGFVAEVWNRCIVGMESGLFEFDPVTGDLIAIPESSPGMGMRYNDACVDAEGRLWAGTMSLDGESPSGALCCFPTIDERWIIDTGYRRINGLAHDGARDRLWISDSHPDVRAIWSMDLQTGDIAASRTEILTLPEELGRPDGAFIDTDGRYWVATLEGSSILHPGTGRPPSLVLSVPLNFPTKAAVERDGCFYLTSKQSSGDQLGGLLIIARARSGVSSV